MTESDRGRADVLRPKADLEEKPTALARPRETGGGLRRAASMVRAALPVVQKLLPLLEGNWPMAAVNLLTPAATAEDRIEPLKEALGELQAENRSLRSQATEQAAAIKHLEEQLEEARAEAERQQLAAQEAAEDVRKLRTRLAVALWVGVGLVLLLLAANVFLLVQFLRAGR